MSNIDPLMNGHKFIDGRLVSAKIERLVRAIKDYSEELEVKWIPPEERRNGEAAYAIIHDPVGQPPYVLFYVRKDEDFDERVLYRIISSDQRSGTPTWDAFSAWEETQRRINEQEYLDKMEEAADMAAHLIRTHKNTYKFNDNLIIKEGMYGNQAHSSRKLYYT